MRFQVGERGAFPAVHPVAAMCMPLARGASGILTLRRGPIRRLVCFRDGQPNRAESNSPREALPTLLVSRGVLDKKLAKAIVDECREDGRNPVEALVAREVIEPEKVEGYLRWRAAFLLVSSGSWPDGDYRFKPQAEPSLPGPPLTLRLPQLMLKALLRDGAHMDLQRRLMPFMGQQLSFVDDLPCPVDEFRVEEADSALLDAIDGTRSVAECVAAASGEPRRATCLAWLLLVAGMAETALSFASAREDSGIQRSSTAYMARGDREVIASATPEDPRAETSGTAGRPAPSDDEDSIHAEAAPPPLDDDADDEVRELQSHIDTLGKSLFGGGFATEVSASELKRRQTARAGIAELSLDDESDDGEAVEAELAEIAGMDAEQAQRWESLKTDAVTMESSNFFELFGLEVDADAIAIRDAYFELAKRYHPDRYNEEPVPIRREAQRIFARLSEASETLSNEASRKEYIDYKILGKQTPEQAAMEKARAIMDAEAAYRAGVRLLAQGQLTSAHDQFTRAHLGYTEEDDYAVFHAYTTWRLKHTAEPEAAEEAEQTIRNLLQRRPKNPIPLHLLGKISIIKGENEFARELLKRVIRLQPSNAEALSDLRKADAAARKADGKGKLSFGKLFGRDKDS
jgi:curved DNA-binding protein CbpA